MRNTNGVLDVQVVNENNTYTPDVSTWYDSINGSFYKEDPVNGTDITDSMGDVQIKFMVPEGYIAVLEASLTVDDWGRLDIVSAGESGENHLHLGMMKNVDDVPGPRGGHALWSKHGNVALPPGEYIIYVYHENATYVDAYADKAKYNISQCDFSITARKFRGACLLNWPADPVPLGTPITWYELNTRPSDRQTRRWNTGIISSISPAAFKQMAKIIYCEAAPAGQYTQQEMRGIASVMLNRMGNSESQSYRSGSVVQDITTEFSDSKNWESIAGPLYQKLQNTEGYDSKGESCQKLQDAISALHYVLQNGAIFIWDSFVGKGFMDTTHPENYLIHGGTAFRINQVYYQDSRTKPANWDTMDIDKNSPLAAKATENDTVS